MRLKSQRMQTGLSLSREPQLCDEEAAERDSRVRPLTDLSKIETMRRWNMARLCAPFPASGSGCV
jgi:hypothetical protein